VRRSGVVGRSLSAPDRRLCALRLPTAGITGGAQIKHSRAPLKLVLAAGTALVGAIATDTWQQVTEAVGGLWQRAHQRQRAREIETDLAELREHILRARGQAADHIGSFARPCDSEKAADLAHIEPPWRVLGWRVRAWRAALGMCLVAWRGPAL